MRTSRFLASAIAASAMCLPLSALAATAVPGVPNLTAATDTGQSNTDDITRNATPVFTVACVANGDIIKIYKTNTAGPLLSTATCASSVATLTASGASADGTYSFVATASGSGIGATISAASAGLSVTIDTVAPQKPRVAPDLAAASDSGTSSTDNITSSTTPIFSGSGSNNGTAFVLRLYANGGSGGTLFGTGSITHGSGSVTAHYGDNSTLLPDGTYTVSATQVDVAGNESHDSSSLSVTIDTTAPTVSSLSPADDVTSAGTGGTLVAVFSEDMVAASGNLTVKNSNNGGTHAYLAANASAVSVVEETVTVSVEPFDQSASYYVLIDSGMFEDVAGNDFAGIASVATWNFTILARTSSAGTSESSGGGGGGGSSGSRGRSSGGNSHSPSVGVPATHVTPKTEAGKSLVERAKERANVRKAAMQDRAKDRAAKRRARRGL